MSDGKRPRRFSAPGAEEGKGGHADGRHQSQPAPTLRKRWIHRFRCAGRGLAWVLAREPSGRVHAVALGPVAVLGVWLKISAAGWAVLALACGMVVAAEALNTAIERLADRVSPEREESIRLVKDLAAGGVLAAVMGAVAAGLAVLGPPLWARLREWG